MSTVSTLSLRDIISLLTYTDLIKYDYDIFCPHPFSNYDFSGFAAEAPVSTLQTLSTQDTQYKPNIEEDKVVNAYGDYAAV
jgi:hypothetical protein